MITWFHKASFGECTDELVNPDRGFYQIFPFAAGEAFSETEIGSCLVPEESLVLVLFDIGGYANRELPGEELERMRQILALFVREKKDIILRVCYDTKGAAMGREPSLFSYVGRHMEQVAPVAAEFGERILVWQGLLIGNWGEMHGSRYLDEKYLVSLADTLYAGRKGSGFHAVRTPAQRRLLIQNLRNADAQSGERRGAGDQPAGIHKSGIGIFDDAILGSANDRGTYSMESPDRESGIDEMCRAGLYAPCGGEAVWGEGYAGGISPEKTLEYLSRIRVTYLNRQHDRKLLEYWKTVSCKQKGVFAQHTLYDYIKAHLGYRFVVRDVRVKRKKTAGGFGIEVRLRIENTGFAPIYRHTESFLLWRDNGGREERLRISMDLQGVSDVYENKFWVEITETGTDCRGSLSLLTRRAFDQTLIRFANAAEPDGSVRLGEW